MERLLAPKSILVGVPDNGDIIVAELGIYGGCVVQYCPSHCLTLKLFTDPVLDVNVYIVPFDC